MTFAQNTIWEQFLQPLFQLFIDEKPLKELYERIDWSKEYDRLCNPDLVAPDCYEKSKL